MKCWSTPHYPPEYSVRLPSALKLYLQYNVCLLPCLEGTIRGGWGQTIITSLEAIKCSWFKKGCYSGKRLPLRFFSSVFTICMKVQGLWDMLALFLPTHPHAEKKWEGNEVKRKPWLCILIKCEAKWALLITSTDFKIAYDFSSFLHSDKQFVPLPALWNCISKNYLFCMVSLQKDL